MKLLVTGAAGFIGRFVTAEAAGRGHKVVALVRQATNAQNLVELRSPHVDIVVADLNNANGQLLDCLSGVDTVIHLAGALTGTLEQQLQGTVGGTRNLLSAMHLAGRPALVSSASFAVYDYPSIPAGSLITESSPIVNQNTMRDAYSHAKLLQENLVSEYLNETNQCGAILRIGAVYGQSRLWNARLGFQLTPRTWLTVTSGAALPLTYVENCAEAMVTVSERCREFSTRRQNLILNVLDEALPTGFEYAKQLAGRMATKPTIVSLPWYLLRAVSAVLTKGNTMVGGKLRLPSVLQLQRAEARFKPFRFSNQLLRDTLGWSPRFGLAEALERSFDRPALSS